MLFAIFHVTRSQAVCRIQTPRNLDPILSSIFNTTNVISDHGRLFTVFSMSAKSGFFEISRGWSAGGSCTSRIMGIS